MSLLTYITCRKANRHRDAHVRFINVAELDTVLTINSLYTMYQAI